MNPWVYRTWHAVQVTRHLHPLCLFPQSAVVIDWSSAGHVSEETKSCPFFFSLQMSFEKEHRACGDFPDTTLGATAGRSGWNISVTSLPFLSVCSPVVLKRSVLLKPNGWVTLSEWFCDFKGKQEIYSQSVVPPPTPIPPPKKTKVPTWDSIHLWSMICNPDSMRKIEQN